MLKHLHIQNLVIIDELDLQFQAGMTVFTGETGAGKSILIDALGLVLGDRAETSIIRDNSDRAEITATFNISKLPRITPLLEEQAIETENDELIIRRVISRDGRSRAFVNSSQVPVQVLRLIGEYLIDIHGQHAHQSLMKKSIQRTLLDHHARHFDRLEAVRNAFDAWQTATTGLARLSNGAQDHEATVSLLQYQVQELEELAPAEGEFDGLEDEFKRLANASRLLEVSHAGLEQLHTSEQSVDTQLHQIARNLRDLVKYDASLNRIVELIDAALIQLDEATGELRLYADGVDIDPEQLSTL
ncbi:MAG: AAA family ATPase, partial [Gammaproteobacteria bacterium]